MFLWKRCLDELRHQVPEQTFVMWLRPLRAMFDACVFVVVCPNAFFLEQVRDHYLQDIQRLVMLFSEGEVVEVDIRVDNPVDKSVDDLPQSTQAAALGSAGGQVGTLVQGADSALVYLNPNFTFETFVTGKSNGLAYRSCYELAKELSKRQSDPEARRNNPLFIYGYSGLGKTHLMHSVAHKYVKAKRRFYYFTSENFVRELVTAIQKSKIDTFKKKIKQVDLLIIDDIHMLAGKNKSSQEFLSLFESFINSGKQLILASDRHPAQMKEFDEHFRSRLSWGLVVAIDPPEIDTRVQILQKKAVLSGIDLPKECALFIAQNVASDVRRLEGALNQVMANANLTGSPITLEMVRYALKDVVAMRVQAVNMDNIRKVVAEYYDISVKDLMGKKRARNISRPRQVAMALARELTGSSYPDIGQSFGGRDHSTVIHACEKIAELREKEPNLDKDFKSLMMMLQAG